MNMHMITDDKRLGRLDWKPSVAFLTTYAAPSSLRLRDALAGGIWMRVNEMLKLAFFAIESASVSTANGVIDKHLGQIRHELQAFATAVQKAIGIHAQGETLGSLSWEFPVHISKKIMEHSGAEREDFMFGLIRLTKLFMHLVMAALSRKDVAAATGILERHFAAASEELKLYVQKNSN